MAPGHAAQRLLAACPRDDSMTNDRETLPDLIETRSAEHTIPRRKLWQLAFAAILDGALNPALAS